ncbi:hypothetical protein MHYP_G00092240 [Metynnis hypsauchen]
MCARSGPYHTLTLWAMLWARGNYRWFDLRWAGVDIPEKGQLQFQGNRIHIYPDFSADVARRRAAFTAIKPKLREAGIEYGLLFPARLRINHNGVKHVFESPQQVTVFLQGLSLSPDANVQ